MKAVKIGPDLRLLSRGYIRFTNHKGKCTKKLHATQATRTNREATDFCVAFCIKKATAGRYRMLCMGISQCLDKHCKITGHERIRFT